MNLINNTIKTEKLKYAIPVYNLNNFEKIHDLELIFTIDDKLFMESLLLAIRGETIKFSSNLKKNERMREQVLIKDIEELEKNPNLSQTGDLLQDKHLELEEIRKIRLHGEMIRSRVLWLDEGEKPSRYFCALENTNYLNKTMKKIRIGKPNNEKILTDQHEILCEVASFYKRLFSNKDSELKDINLETLFEHQPNKIPKNKF